MFEMRNKTKKKERRINMKRNAVTVFILVFAFFLNGCSGVSLNKAEVKLPTEICVKNKILSYYDDADDFEKCGFSVGENFLDVLPAHNTVIASNDGKVRLIVIEDNSISTYKNITVGTSKKEIEDTFQFEIVDAGDSYDVLFDGDVEVDSKKPERDNDFIWISYSFENDVVSRILICDMGSALGF